MMRNLFGLFLRIWWVIQAIPVCRIVFTRFDVYYVDSIPANSMRTLRPLVTNVSRKPRFSSDGERTKSGAPDDTTAVGEGNNLLCPTSFAATQPFFRARMGRPQLRVYNTTARRFWDPEA